jgi:thiosulfate dehydrogenase
MTMHRRYLKLGALVLLVSVALLVERGVMAQQGGGETLKVTPCDGGEPVTVAGVSAGVRLPRERAQAVADNLMDGWLARQDPMIAASWVRERDNALATAEPQAAGTPGQKLDQHDDFSARDREIWEREVDREIAYGNKLFHDDKEIGSPEGIACAMCHPNASNTHPETYPKFQVQLKRTALLRDMINWCIENPVRGKKLAADDPKMRALEAYILAQRKGVELDYGKH